MTDRDRWWESQGNLCSQHTLMLTLDMGHSMSLSSCEGMQQKDIFKIYISFWNTPNFSAFQLELKCSICSLPAVVFLSLKKTWQRNKTSLVLGIPTLWQLHLYYMKGGNWGIFILAHVHEAQYKIDHLLNLFLWESS